MSTPMDSGGMSPLVAVVQTQRFSAYSTKTLQQAALEVFSTPCVFEKARLTQVFCEAWRQGWIRDHLGRAGQAEQAELPAWPGRPAFSSPSDELLPGQQRSTKNMMKHNTMEFTIHGIANAESYAIDLFWDIMFRFSKQRPAIPREFFDDMVYIAQQEAEHFCAWTDRLADYSIPFGAFPSNDALWHCAMDTFGSITERLAIVNLTHEAKGLDSYMKSKEKLLKLGDIRSLEILEHNILEEVGHVRLGIKWFSYFCQEDHLEPKAEYQRLYRQFFKGPLRPPFNKAFRDLAGMTEDWYLPIADGSLPTSPCH